MIAAARPLLFIVANNILVRQSRMLTIVVNSQLISLV